MTKLIALAAILASSAAHADKLSDLDQANTHDRGCESIPAFYTKERKDCVDGMAVQTRLCTAPLICPDPGRVRTDIATAETKLRNAEARSAAASTQRSRAKTADERKKADAEVRAAANALTEAKETRTRMLAMQSTLKKDNATMAAKIGKCVDARTAVLNTFQYAHDRLRKEKPDKPQDKASVDNVVRSLGDKYSVELRGHKIQLDQLKGAQKDCEAHL